MDEDTARSLIEFVDQTKMGTVTDTRSGRASVQSETDKLEDSASRNLMNFSELCLLGGITLHTRLRDCWVAVLLKGTGGYGGCQIKHEPTSHSFRMKHTVCY